ncbi:MAG TPA: PD-(D/E)XK nuclease family protein [Acidimicrobiales bacterium]|nr:PD-(D/E)XK nuclease family protein [Acidimicrobiales bacterium]
MDIGLCLTAEQQAIVDGDGDLQYVAGSAGTGKTVTLVARYLRLVAERPASEVLVLCATRRAAERFVDMVLPSLAGGFDALPITTPWGLAYDVLARHDAPPVLLTGADQREEVARLLAPDGPGRWPSAAGLVGRRAFASEVAGAVIDLESSMLSADRVLTRAEAIGQRARWADLVGFTARYRAALADQGMVDVAGLLVAATEVLDRPDASGAHAGTGRFTHVLVDDAHLGAPATAHLVRRLAATGASLTVATDPGAAVSGVDPWGSLLAEGATPSRLTTTFVAPAVVELVTCSHPSVEAEAVVGELLAARGEGVAWSDMAVLVRSPRGARARAIARALARHHVPTGPVTGVGGDEPVVRGVLDVLAWVAGDTAALDRVLASPVAALDPAEVRSVRREAATMGIPLEAHPRVAALARLRADLVARAAKATPADLAFEVWRQCLGHLVDGGDGGGGGDDRSLDALVAMLDGLRRRAERRPHERLSEFVDRSADEGVDADAWEPGQSSGDEVAIVSITGAAGRHWHTVVVAGCVEGELPRVATRARFFDRHALSAAPATGGHAADTVAPPDASERRRLNLGDERVLFSTAVSRAGHRLVATAAPEPGVLLSRFVEGWPTAGVRLPLAPGADPVTLASTESTTPVFPDGHLRLSASQLSTYDDCPLRYAYEYGLGVRGESGPQAALGSLVHDVLATFTDPAADNPVPHTRHGLLDLAAQRWRDDIARYRPQVEEARRDYFAMLDTWWEAEGEDDRLAPEILAVERHFEVEVGGHRLTGYIDRIDRAGDGIRIVDYKTGKAEPRLDAVADDVQLAVYHLAATRDPELAALGPVTQLRLLYVRTMHAFDQPVTDDHEAITEARVAAAATRILAEEFEPSVDANCRLCSFHRLCPLQDEGRVTGTAS